jgi:hypothetical protein
VVEYFVQNLYQAGKIFVDWLELYSDFAALSIKKRSKRQVQIYKGLTRKKKKAKKSEVLASFVSSIIRYVCLASLN